MRNQGIVALVWVMLAVVPFPANAATLKSETVAAWENYVRIADGNLQERVRAGRSFLWTFEDSERHAKVCTGEIVIAPAPGAAPKRVPGGLIHHWMGAMFVPNVKLDEILEVTRDYDRYKEFYRPSVVDSKAIARDGSHDKFSMLLMNQAFFLRTALDADYQATYVRLDDRRFYTISSTTRVQEIEEYGQESEHRVPEGEGGGYIWKLHSISRFEQRDGGVYVELEAIALSRDIPVALRFVVDPIVRRVSRNSLLTSLQQTEKALRPGEVAANAGYVGGVSASLANKTSAFVRIH